MHILITDSGVGGLSVCAYAERFVRLRGFSEPVRLTFANAAPANDYGYNSMKTTGEKVETFDRFLTAVNERFSPDLIYVACNTLSVLLGETPFFSSGQVAVKGIVETGVELLLCELRSDPKSVAMIFGTETTIEAGTYPRLLEEGGVVPSRIVSQECPGLASTISEDREGSRSAGEIRRCVRVASGKLEDRNAPVLAYLACTHYGYRRELFASALAEEGIEATVLNPNELAIDDLFGTATDRDILSEAKDPLTMASAHRGRGSFAPLRMTPVSSSSATEVEVQFYTRYAIPGATIEALTYFLGEISPRTVAAMRSFVHAPELF